MGRIRQRNIKNTAADLLREHGEKFNSDFKHNRDVLKDLINVEGSVMRNRIAGYLTRLVRNQASA